MKKAFLLIVSASAMLVACESANNKSASGKTSAADTTAAGTIAESKEERNKKVIMESMQAMLAKDVDQALKDAAPDLVDYGDGSSPPIKGKDSIVTMVKQYVNAFPDVKGENLTYVADGDWVMVWGEWSGTFKNDFMGMKATNKSFKMKDVDIFRFNEDGKVIEHHFVQSPHTMMAQLGVPQPKK